ncbi:3483_t:CDS:1, partial [Racocetra persica]
SVQDKLRNDDKQDNQHQKSKKSVCSSSSIDSWKLFDHAMLLTSQATILTANFLTHHLSGPRKPSWPIQLTLICAAMRALTEHTHLADVDKIRMFISIPFIFSPSDIVVTPVSFRVLNRGLPGILKDLEDCETGNREISAEWVVPKGLWRKINDDYHLSAAHYKHIYVDQDGIKWSNEKVILYLHGGAYYLMSAKTHRELNYRLSKVTGRRVF